MVFPLYIFGDARKAFFISIGGETMPSVAILEKKKAVVSELTEQIKGSVSGVVVCYQGITVADDTVLRKQLREAGVKVIM